MERRVDVDQIFNVSVVRNDEKALQMGNKKVDRVLLCDTYHHFEYHQEMLAAIFDQLNPGGEVVLVDFNRIPGASREWIIRNVRAGKQTFRDEFIAAGFEYDGEVLVPLFNENYLLKFRKPSED